MLSRRRWNKESIRINTRRTTLRRVLLHGRPPVFIHPRKSISVLMVLNVYFAALMAATKGSPWMGPSFTWMDQDPAGPGPAVRRGRITRSKRIRPAVEGRSSDVHGRSVRFERNAAEIDFRLLHPRPLDLPPPLRYNEIYHKTKGADYGQKKGEKPELPDPRPGR